MQVKGFDSHGVRLVLSRHELGIMGNALNEVCSGLRVADFASKMGGEEPRVYRILRDIIPVYRKMERAGASDVSIQFSRFELRAIIGALRTVCEEIDLIEFRTSMGATRDEVDAILDIIIPIFQKMKEAEVSAEDE